MEQVVTKLANGNRNAILRKLTDYNDQLTKIISRKRSTKIEMNRNRGNISKPQTEYLKEGDYRRPKRHFVNSQTILLKKQLRVSLSYLTSWQVPYPRESISNHNDLVC